MEQYISKSALVAEIERKIHNIDYEGLSDRNIGQEQSLYHILSFLDTLEVMEIGVDLGDPKGDKSAEYIIDTKTLEVKEVDLEKEIELIKGDYEQVDVAWNNDFDFIAHHFYELGQLNARKEE